MDPTVHRELERKYDVDESALLPLLHELPGVASVDQPVEHRLSATYYDTSDLALARAKVTLRRRVGGDDAGWHLKRPAGSGPVGSRDELRLPLGRARRPPEELLAAVRVVVRDHRVEPVATITTRRVVHVLRDAEGQPLAELADDHVDAERHDAPPDAEGKRPVQHWREWELELVVAPPDFLDQAQSAILATGAQPAAAGSKLARTLEIPYTAGPPKPVKHAAKHKRRATAGDVVAAYLYEQVTALQACDPRARRDAPDAVHQMRVATRRLRSVLATYRPALDRMRTDQVRDELQWLGGMLGAPRDAEVMRARLAQLVETEPLELVIGSVAERIDDELRAKHDVAHERLRAALDEGRYFRLLDTLDELTTDPPLAPAAAEPAEALLRACVQRDRRRLARTVTVESAARERANGVNAEVDMLLHAVRKAAKRLRYGAELAVVSHGGNARRLARAAKSVQEALGEHQDSVVSRNILRDMGVRAHLDGQNAFTFGRLHALEEARAATARNEFDLAWHELNRRRVVSWLT